MIKKSNIFALPNWYYSSMDIRFRQGFGGQKLAVSIGWTRKMAL
jgi:hypothetical protein